MSYRTVNQQFAAKIEAESGIEEEIDPVADAVKVRSPIQFTADFERIETDYVTGSLSRSESETGGGGGSTQPSVFLRGSGEPGVPPDYGKLIRACGFSETITASAITGTAVAAEAKSITLAAAASEVDDIYVGMPVLLVGGAGQGQIRVIAAYDGASKTATVNAPWEVTPDATTEYEIPANVLYRPVSAGTETITIHTWQHHNTAGQPSRRRRLMGAAGTFSLTGAPRSLVEMAFQIRGILPAKPDDVPKPGAPNYDAGMPRAVMSAASWLGDRPFKWSEYSFDLGATVDQGDDPAAEFGYDIAEVMDRAASGRITAAMTLASTRDAFADWLDGKPSSLWLAWGKTPGERSSIWHPRFRYTGNEQSDVRGKAAEQMPFESRAADAEIFICLF
ncbi:hypothetical protein [Telmatospirillum sp. J64-1]|uniref:hypothetical protein n=1 Tax=Telmatospirillum sp. J64-1 TaxID=2502183 RepID=UPI00115DF336|nr:hypothetical protein [Telmatospirillum sp. J64-1]